MRKWVFLVAAKGPPKGKVKTQIHILTLKTQPSTIVCVSLDDLEDCQNGGSFLRLIATRYLEVRTGAGALIAGMNVSAPRVGHSAYNVFCNGNCRNCPGTLRRMIPTVNSASVLEMKAGPMVQAT